MKESDDDPLWDLDKIREKLKVARSTLHEAQKKHKENRNTCLREALEKKEPEVKEADDPAKAKKAAAAIESVIKTWNTRIVQ
jgi:flagellar motility protein MotE (MotC chaperone)